MALYRGPRRAQKLGQAGHAGEGAAVTPGECCGCLRAPVNRLRFNLVVEDATHRRPHTQLLCQRCTYDLLKTVIGRSVERTPQAELDGLPPFRDQGWEDDE
jgi:hypothetical protein